MWSFLLSSRRPSCVCLVQKKWRAHWLSLTYVQIISPTHTSHAYPVLIVFCLCKTLMCHLTRQNCGAQVSVSFGLFIPSEFPGRVLANTLSSRYQGWQLADLCWPVAGWATVIWLLPFLLDISPKCHKGNGYTFQTSPTGRCFGQWPKEWAQTSRESSE